MEARSGRVYNADQLVRGTMAVIRAPRGAVAQWEVALMKPGASSSRESGLLDPESVGFLGRPFIV